MTKSFHFLQGTKVVGPLQLDELKSLIQKGVVSGQTMLSDDATNWKPAGELVPQLLGQRTNSGGGQSKSSGAEQWYVQSNSQQYGPISYTELLGWTGSGSVIAETLVRKSENGAWQRADAVFPHLRPRAERRDSPGSQKVNANATISIQLKPNKTKSETAKAESEQGITDQEVLAKIGIGTVIFVVVGGYLLYNFVLEPQLKTALGPIGWCVAWLVFGLIRVSLMETIKRNLE